VATHGPARGFWWVHETKTLPAWRTTEGSCNCRSGHHCQPSSTIGRLHGHRCHTLPHSLQKYYWITVRFLYLTLLVVERALEPHTATLAHRPYSCPLITGSHSPPALGGLQPLHPRRPERRRLYFKTPVHGHCIYVHALSPPSPSPSGHPYMTPR
jgi:hypothetical protein